MEIKAEKIHKVFGKDVVLEDISFAVEKRQKIGVVGYNGTGKSTLLKILAGIVEPDGGKLEKREGVTIGYAPQDMSISGKGSIREIIIDSVGYGIDDYKIEIVLAGLGLKGIPISTDLEVLSSGQKEKIFLAGILLKEPDILLLDEPTNNLDIKTLIWLEKFLKDSDSACLIVSHDRVFLNNVVDRIFEIDWRKRNLIISNGKYSDFLKEKEIKFKKQSEDYAEHQKELKRLEGVIKDKRSATVKGSKWKSSDNDKYLRGFKRDRASSSGRIVKSTKKKVEMLKKEAVERPVNREVFRIDLTPARAQGTDEILFEEVVIGYKEGFKSEPFTLRIPFGNRVVIMGNNGSGKSTFLKVIAGMLKPISGEFKKGNSLVVGNLMQEHENLPKDETLLGFLQNKTSFSKQEVYALVVKFGFNSSEVRKKIGEFSPGGRSRILFALFTALSVNVLLLDEPTNHLDLEALNALEEVITNYEGTIVLVSHDRYFLKKFTPSDIFIIDEGVLERVSSYQNYLKKAKAEAKKLIYRF